MKHDESEERRNRKMRKDNIALLALFLLTVMAFSLAPVKAFIYPDGSVDGLYENFGPRLDRIQVIMYDGLDAMWTGLQNGEIDVTDWPLTHTWLTTFISPPANETVQVVSYGGEAGMYLVDFNLNNNEYLGNPPGYPEEYPNPVSNGPAAAVQNPASNVNFRRGVSYLFNRTWYQGIIAGWGIMIYTPVPSYLGSPNPGEGLINQDIRPGGLLEALTYPNNEADADTEFALAKMKIVAGQNGGKRFWDRDDDNICDPGEEIVLNINSRQDVGRSKSIEWLDARLIAHGFVTDTQYMSGAQNYQETMLDKNYHMTTLGWINMGPDPDFLYDLYHVTGYWHDPESACPNTQDLNDTITNYWAEGIKFNLTVEGARLSAWKFQERFATIAAQIPLYSADGYKAHSRTYVGGTPAEAAYVSDNWLSLCNQMGLGDNSWYSFENAYPEGHDFSSGDMTIRYGWKETGYPQHINPLYSESYWDTEVLTKVYDTLGHRDPCALSMWQPYLIENWTVGTWMDGAVEKSKVKITLRPNVKWADGYAVTVDDVMYSLTQVAHDLVNAGYPPPWSWPTTENVQSAYGIDPYNVEILFAVKSFLAQSWALGGFYIIPKHIWKPIINSGDPTGFAADPNVIGSGPWRYVSMTTGTSLLMVANRPGSTVTTDRLGAIAITSPGVFSGEPVDVQIYEQSYLAEFLPDPVNDLTYVVKLHNMWWGHPLTVDKTVTITTPDGTTVYTTTGLVLTPSTPDIETFTVDRTKAGKHTVTVTVTYMKGTIPVTTTVTLDPWITIPEDIGGSVMGTPGFPIPDFRVDQWDLLAYKAAVLTTPGDLRWNPWADVTGDYKIDGKDGTRIATKYGWNIKLIGDINRDNKVDGRDIAKVAKAYGTLDGDPGYSIDADLYYDGKIEGRDIAIVSQQFGMVDP
jgi:ABC-type transport system substrate-binding protein